MKKRLLSITTIFAVLLCMSLPLCCYATEDDHGADAHSSTMSVEADGTRVEDYDADGNYIGDVVDGNDAEDAVETAPIEAEEITDEESADTSNVWLYIVLIAVLAVGVIIGGVKLNSKSKKKQKKTYKGKH